MEKKLAKVSTLNRGSSAKVDNAPTTTALAVERTGVTVCPWGFLVMNNTCEFERLGVHLFVRCDYDVTFWLYRNFKLGCRCLDGFNCNCNTLL